LAAQLLERPMSANDHNLTDPKFTLYWCTGRRDVVSGRTPAEAMTLAGFGGGSIRALDFYADGDDTNYRWDEKTREWITTP